MVEEIKKEGRSYFKCEECNMLYEDRELAEKCQKWCKEHNSCNIDIIRHAIKKE